MSELGISEVNEIKGKAPEPKVLDCLKNAIDSDELEVILTSQGAGESWLEQIEMLRLQKRLAEAEKELEKELRLERRRASMKARIEKSPELQKLMKERWEKTHEGTLG